MSPTCPEGSDGGVAPWNAAALRAADGLALAASPTFAVMALLSGILADDPAEILCSAAHLSPFGGMVTMYLIMSAFHLSPWLRLLPKKRHSACGRADWLSGAQAGSREASATP